MGYAWCLATHLGQPSANGDVTFLEAVQMHYSKIPVIVAVLGTFQ